MNIQRTEKIVVEAPKQNVSDLAAGTVFKVGKKLFIKTDAGAIAEGVRLTTGELTEFDVDDVADEVVEGTFNYA